MPGYDSYRGQGGYGSYGGGGYGQMRAPEVPRRDWRDLFVGPFLRHAAMIERSIS